MDMEHIMGASLGEVSSKIRTIYKKTVQTKQYESEVIEVETTLDMGDEKLTGAERMLISAILNAQLEYTVYCSLAFKGMVTSTELNDRKAQLVNSINALKMKAETVTGKSMDKYFEHLDLDKVK